MLAEQEDVYYYITLMNENYVHPAMPDGCARGDPARHVSAARRRQGGRRTTPRVQLFGSGAILREVLAAADLLANDWNVAARRVERHELQRTRSATASRRDRWNMLHPGETAARAVRRSNAWTDAPAPASPRPTTSARSPKQIRPFVGRRYVDARDRRLRAQRLPAQAARVLRGGPALRRASPRCKRARRRRRRSRSRRVARSDREVRHRSRTSPIRSRCRERTSVSETIEVRVPDIGDFKDVPVIEVLVKPGDRVKKERLARHAREREGVDGSARRAPTASSQDVRVKVGDKVSQGSRRSSTLLTTSGSVSGAAGGARSDERRCTLAAGDPPADVERPRRSARSSMKPAPLRTVRSPRRQCEHAQTAPSGRRRARARESRPFGGSRASSASISHGVARERAERARHARRRAAVR